MTKLKTLKDLERWDCEACGGDIMHRPEIKQEAIKWVKEFGKRGMRIKRFDFMRFHNITEEDLKWET